MSVKRLASVLIVIGAFVPAAALGLGSRTVTPSHSTRIAVLKAFGDAPAAYPCLKVRLAASNHRYATVRFVTTSSCVKWAANGVSVFKRHPGNHWKELFEGSSFACPLAHIPRSVQRDFGICP